MLEALVLLLERHLSGDSVASVLLADEDGTRLWHGAAPHLPAEYNAAIDGIAIGPQVGSCGTAAHRRAPVVVADIATDPLWEDFRDLALPCGLAACWSAPIIGTDGELLGTFAVYTRAPGEPPARDYATLMSFAQAAAVAIARDRDMQRLLRAKRRAEALVNVGKAITARLELGDIVQLVTDATTELTGAAFGAFFHTVTDAAGGSHMLYAVSGTGADTFTRFPMPRNTPLFARTFKGEGIVRLDDVTTDKRFGRNPPHQGLPEGHPPLRSYLAVPVVTSDAEVAGGLFFGHPDPGVFGVEAEEVVVGIAAQAAIAIENARLYDAARREIAARERAFRERDRVATVLQESLLPPALPPIPGVDAAAVYRAASQDIGGDFYDVFAIDARRWCVVIGDVCGKGAEAAARTSLARHTARAAASIDPTPSEVLRVMNTVLLDSDDQGTFCTASVLLLELDAGGAARLTAAGAGHPPALVATAGGVRELRAGGPVLGVLDTFACADETVELASGDVVLLYTDGLFEIRTPGGGILGETWLREALARAADAPAHELLATLTDRALSRQRDGAPRDDIAAVALRLT